MTAGVRNQPPQAARHWSVITAMAYIMMLAMTVRLSVASSHKDHRHGGVRMGQINECDDAKKHIEIDWDPKSTVEHTCSGNFLKPTTLTVTGGCVNETLMPLHVCYPEHIAYNDTPPTSGPHRPNWPAYGEYRYVPPQRWLHSLEHGAIVMLYHPCADPEQVKKLHDVVTGCLRRHVITPYSELPLSSPLALVSWGCKLLMSQTFHSVAQNFIMKHALQGPEQVAGDGNYKTAIVKHAETVMDYMDSELCPSEPPKSPAQDNDGRRKDSTQTLGSETAKNPEHVQISKQWKHQALNPHRNNKYHRQRNKERHGKEEHFSELSKIKVHQTSGGNSAPSLDNHEENLSKASSKLNDSFSKVRGSSGRVLSKSRPAKATIIAQSLARQGRLDTLIHNVQQDVDDLNVAFRKLLSHQ